MNRRKFLKRWLVAAPVAAAAGAGYGHYIERHDVEVVPVDLDLGLGRPLTAALLSDFHFDPLFEIDYLRTVVAATHRAAPDLVLYAGDFVSHSTDRLPELLDVLQRAEATFGQFA